MRYEFQDGHYLLISDHGTVLDRSDEIAIVYDNTPGLNVLCKYGTPKVVENYYRTAVEQYRKFGYHSIADSLVLIQGKFPVEELNKLISITGYINIFVKKHELACVRNSSKVDGIKVS